MNELSPFRLGVLRATYLLIVVGLGLDIAPLLLQGTPPPSLMAGVVRSVLGAIALMAALGLRYPVAMIPLLLFELAWKSIWLVVYGLPLWAAGGLGGAAGETFQACALGLVVFPLALPWGYVWRRFARQPADPWRRAAAPARRAA